MSSLSEQKLKQQQEQQGKLKKNTLNEKLYKQPKIIEQHVVLT